LLPAGDSSIEHGHDGSTPRMNAAANGENEILEVLIAKGADTTFVNKSTGDTSLILAAAHLHYETVEILLDQPAPGVQGGLM